MVQSALERRVWEVDFRLFSEAEGKYSTGGFGGEMRLESWKKMK